MRSPHRRQTDPDPVSPEARALVRLEGLGREISAACDQFFKSRGMPTRAFVPTYGTGLGANDSKPVAAALGAKDGVTDPPPRKTFERSPSRPSGLPAPCVREFEHFSTITRKSK
jgi:hypothetical protein